MAKEYPLRRPQNMFRIYAGRADIRNHFIPDRHEILNESATFILELCDGEHSIIQIWQKLQEEFEIDDPEKTLFAIVRMIRYLQQTYILYPCTIPKEQHLDPADPSIRWRP